MRLRALFVLCCGTALQAASIPAAGYLDQVVLCDTNNTHCAMLASVNTSSQTYSNTFQVAGNAFNVSANDQLAPGVLHSYTHFDTPVAQTFYTQFQIVDQVYEDFTFGGGTPGSLGYVSPSFTITGVSTANANAALSMFYADSTDGVIHTLAAQYTAGNASMTFGPIPYHNGAPIMIAFAYATIVYPSGTLSGTADFSHTVVLTGLSTYADLAETTKLSNTTIGASSGATYSANGIVPEPGTFATMGAGLLAAVLLRRKFLAR